MPQNITRHIKDMIEEANAEVETIDLDTAKAMLGREDVQFIDIRDVRELKSTGRIPGARHVPRGMLEFWIDPESPYHKDFFDADCTYVFYCASAWRSALATKAARDMGLAPVCHLAGGFNAWKDSGAEVEAPRD